MIPSPSHPTGRFGLGRRRHVVGLAILLTLAAPPVGAQSPVVPGPEDAPASPEVAPPDQPPPYRLVADPGQPLEGIAGVRLLLAMSAAEADACAVAQADIEMASIEPLQTAGIPVIDRATLNAQSAAAVPELFVAVTIVHDETGVCAASLLLQLGLDTSVVLLYRNADSPPGTLQLSNAYAELDQSAALLVGVPPTFGDEIRGEIGRRVEAMARAIIAANPTLR